MNTRVVPVDPTAGMVDAAIPYMRECEESRKPFSIRDAARTIYQLMLAAAPPQAEPMNEVARLRAALVRIAEHYTDTDLAAKHMSAHARMTLSPTGDSRDYAWSKKPTTNPDPLAPENIGGDEPTDHLAAPDSHLREQIADAQARQAKGEGILGDCELAHYDEHRGLEMRSLTINARIVPVACIEKCIQFLDRPAECPPEQVEAAAVSLYLRLLLKKDNTYFDEGLVKP